MIERAAADGEARGWQAPVGGVFYGPALRHLRRAVLSRPATITAPPAWAPAHLYFDGADGRLLGERQPWNGTAADIFVQAQFPLHSGRILGLPGRILISVMGLVVAALSVTGVVIWYRKRRARLAVTAACARSGWSDGRRTSGDAGRLRRAGASRACRPP